MQTYDCNFKKVCIDNLYQKVDKYNNTYHRTIKMEPNDAKLITHTDVDVEHNDWDPKFKVRDHARKSKRKNFFSKGYNPNWSQEVHAIKKIENTVYLT